MSKTFNVIVEKIKQTFLLKKFKKSIIQSETITELYDISTQKLSFLLSEIEEINERFDNITRFISRKNVILEINKILIIYYRWNKLDNINFIKINSHQLLSAWIIYYCPGIILGEVDTDYKKNIFDFAKQLLELINNIKSYKKINMVIFNKIFLSYTDSLIIFLEKDKIDKFYISQM